MVVKLVYITAQRFSYYHYFLYANESVIEKQLVIDSFFLFLREHFANHGAFKCEV